MSSSSHASLSSEPQAVDELWEFRAVLETVDQSQLPILGQTLFERLYPQEASTTPAVGDPLHGSFNILFPLTFDNGVRWLVKIPQAGAEAVSALTSEANTMRLLKRQTTIPIPDVLDSSTTNNPLGCPYMIMTFIEGVRLMDVWFGPKEGLRSRRIRALDGIAKAMAQLSKFSFKTGGTLCFDEQDNLDKSCTSPMQRIDEEARFNQDKQEPVFEGYAVSPEPKCYYTQMMDIHPPSDNESERGDHLLLRQLIDWIPEPTTASTDGEPFVLAHPDLHLNNMIVSNEGELRAIIDWDGAVAVPRSRGNQKYPLWLLYDWILENVLQQELGIEDEEAIANRTEDSLEDLAEYRRIYNDLVTEKCLPKPKPRYNSPRWGAGLFTYLRSIYSRLFGSSTAASELNEDNQNLCSISLMAEALDTAGLDPFFRPTIVWHVGQRALDAGDKERDLFVGDLIVMFAKGEVPADVMDILHRGFKKLMGGGL